MNEVKLSWSEDTFALNINMREWTPPFSKTEWFQLSGKEHLSWSRKVSLHALLSESILNLTSQYMCIYLQSIGYVLDNLYWSLACK